MRSENGIIHANRLAIAVAIAKRGDSVSIDDVKDAEESIAYAVKVHGAKVVVDGIRDNYKQIEKQAIKDDMADAYNLYIYESGEALTFNPIAVHHNFEDGDLAKLKNWFHNFMAIAEESSEYKTGLKIIAKHSLFGIAYANAAKRVSNGCKHYFQYPSAQDVFYDFGRLLAKVQRDGVVIPRKYRKYIIWKRK